MLPLAYEGTKPRLGAIDTDQKAALRPWERPRSRGFSSQPGLERHRRTRTLSLRRRRISALKYGFGNPLPLLDLAGAAPTAPASMAFFQTSQFTSSALSRLSSPASIRRSISAATNELTSAVAKRRRRREYGHDDPAPPRRRDFRNRAKSPPWPLFYALTYKHLDTPHTQRVIKSC